MAGYSGTPLPRKLGIGPAARVRLVGAPAGFKESIGVEPRRRGEADVIVAFATRAAQLSRQFARLRDGMHPDGGLWIAWPKKSSGASTDLSENIVRAIGLAHGLVDNKVCAIDDTWSGLRFVRRLTDRPHP